MPTTGSFQLVEAAIERFDGAPVGERRRWSDEFKAQAVAAALEPGVNVSALARRLGISPSQLFGWRKAFLRRQGANASAGEPAATVEIVVSEVTIRVGADVSEEALRRILRAVRAT
jgi:transposase